MEGEFEREYGEHGGCDGLVRNQYKNIRTQLLSGIVDKDRAAINKKQEAAEQGQSAGMLQRQSWKKKEQEGEKERQEWSELLVHWQGTKHLHQKEQLSGLVTASDTYTCPPPYAPPALGMYPVSTFYIDKGIMSLETPNTQNTETDAHIHHLPNNSPFLNHCTEIGAAMRTHFPLPNATAIPKITWDPKQNPRQFLSAAKDIWTTQTGLHPGNSGSQAEWFRQAVLNGVPESVQQAMKNNPDMLGCHLCVWEKHLVHHLTAAQDKTQQDEKEHTDLQNQLLKLQLAKVREEVNEKKKGKKEPTKIMAQTVQSGGGDITPAYPDFSHTPPWEPHHRRGGRNKQRVERSEGRGKERVLRGMVLWTKPCLFPVW
ncbi:uncharacterized protein LOC115062254 [Echeneis naucrates]|uniref:uncharacterized protein LOC115062254 n=1 Tax=Echeneis naucrates TaxID=173247 RepID=UPI001113B394|nr:uncharacterized protein LOC115062254 [Echeneis naucrates]